MGRALTQEYWWMPMLVGERSVRYWMEKNA